LAKYPIFSAVRFALCANLTVILFNANTFVKYYLIQVYEYLFQNTQITYKAKYADLTDYVAFLINIYTK
ncbi:MAG: hypothetical protein ABIJ40_14190, partial [Bacteroidota bacterium]